MSVDEHWGEVLRKAADQLTPGDNTDYTLKTKPPLNINDSIFGERVTAKRSHDVSVSFAYDLSTRDTIENTSGTGSATFNQGTLLITSGTGVADNEVLSKNTVTYRPGSEAFGMFTAVFEDGGEAGLTQYIGLIDGNDGFAVGFDGADFGVLRRKNTTDVWTPRASFNGDDVSWLDTSKMNIYMIRFGYLGIAPIAYYVYKGIELRWVLMHCTDLTNSQTLPHISIPILPISISSSRASGTGADMSMRSGSWRAGIVNGAGNNFHRHFSQKFTKTVTSALTNILTLQSKTAFKGLTNRINSVIELISMASDGTKSVEISIWLNASVSGTPVFADINALESVMEFDTAGILVTLGEPVFQSNLSKVDSNTISLLEFGYTWHPGDTLTLAANTVSGTSDVSFSINWGEIF